MIPTYKKDKDGNTIYVGDRIKATDLKNPDNCDTGTVRQLLWIGEMYEFCLFSKAGIYPLAAYKSAGIERL